MTDASPELAGVQRRLDRERKARLEAESIAERATADLYASVQDLERVSRRLALLRRTAEAANLAPTIEEVTAMVLREVCTLTGWPVGHLHLVDGHGMATPTAVWHLDDADAYEAFRSTSERTVLDLGVGLPGRVLETGTAIWIDDVTVEKNFPRAAAARESGLRTGFALPVLVFGQVAAILEFFSPKTMPPDHDLLAALSEVGDQLARAVERIRAESDLRMSETQNRMIVERANEAYVAVDTHSVIRDWNQSAARLFGFGREEVIGRTLAETILPTEHAAAHRAGMERLVATGKSRVLGKRVQFNARRKDGWVFPIKYVPWAVSVAGEQHFFAFIEDVSERKDFEDRLQHQALHDALTGLPNRALLLDRIGHALSRATRQGGAIALAFLDLDRFKVVNDSLGHAAGDELLRLVADRLASVVRPGDTLARLGGDEFVVLCEPPMLANQALAIADRIVDELRPPFELAGGLIAVSASIGVLLTSGGADPLALLADADLAMYRAKDRERGTVELFDSSMRDRAVARLSLEGALREAIEHRELSVHYQPVFDLATGAMTGVEALSRWLRPSHGAVPPSDYIPVAEDAGLIVALGQQVLEQLCLDMNEWHEADPTTAPVSVMVNVSTRQLERTSFVERVLGTIATAGLASRHVTLEITESVLVLDSAEIARALWRLREAGIACAIDDFGTGYSSLDRLRRLPVSKLKVDRSFIAELDSEAGRSLVGGIVVMAHSLGLGVVAEGVETSEQLVWMRRLGCDEVQGFLLAMPRPIDELRADPPGLHPAIVGLGEEHEGDEHELLAAIGAVIGSGAPDPRARSLVRELRRLLSLP